MVPSKENQLLTTLQVQSPQIAHAIGHVEQLCSEYHMYGKMLPYRLHTSDPRKGMYMIASIYPIADSVNFIQEYEKIQRHESLFFPKLFVFPITETTNAMVAIEELTKYCREAEFLSYICKEQGIDLPEKIRRDELYPLMEFNEAAHNKAYSEKLRYVYQEKIKRYFKTSFPQKGTKKEKMDFYRDEKYNAEASKLQAYWDFQNREKQNVDLDVLFRGSSTVKRIRIPDFQYQRFAEMMQKQHPDVCFHVSKKIITNHGELPEEIGDEYQAASYEAYYKVLEEKFPYQQYDCVKHIIPTYFEDRDLFYKEADEAVIMSIVRQIQLQHIQAPSPYTLMQKGEIAVMEIPNADFKNFVSLAKQNDVEFSLDTLGKFSKPSPDTITIAYNTYNEAAIKEILNRIVHDKVRYHALSPSQMKTMDTKLDWKMANAKREQKQQELAHQLKQAMVHEDVIE